MMVVGAFNQVQSALRWFVDNFSRIADWRATLLRVVAIQRALDSLETMNAAEGRIEIGLATFEPGCRRTAGVDPLRKFAANGLMASVDPDRSLRS
jgi:hypothetical protein